jgi:hypothetical protein
VLYLGSAIPLETAVGIESIQNPCRDRYDNVDSSQKASGIDSSLSVYSSGMMLQYAGDESSSTWFPIQTLHVCAAVKAVNGGGPLRFVSLDTAAAQRSSNPPLFACIMRRTKGIKVLECHVFVCKSNQAAMALVQSCTHAFEHKEGWMDSMPAGGGSRIIPASDKQMSGGRSIRGGNFFSDRSDLIQKFDVSCRVDDKPKQEAQQACPQPMIMQQTPCGPMMVAMNPPGAPVPMSQPEYFADWSNSGGQPMMIIPESPFYSGEAACKKPKKKKKKKKKVEKDSSSETEEEETYYVKKSALDGEGSCSGSCYGGDSLRSRIRGHGHGHGHGHTHVVEQVPPPQPPPPQIVFVPQPQPAVKSQQNPDTDVVVYAPQVIEANKSYSNRQYDDRDTDVLDYRPDNRSYRRNDERYYRDDRQDNRINYNRQAYRNADYRADQRRYDNREDNRRLDYRADNRSNRMSNKAAAVYGMHDPAVEYNIGAEEQRRRDEEFELGYYNAQLEDYNRELERYYEEEDGDEDYGYYPEEYVAPPGFTDDYGVGDYVRHLPAEPQGQYVLDYVDDYVPVPAKGGPGFNQVADGLGYYP